MKDEAVSCEVARAGLANRAGVRALQVVMLLAPAMSASVVAGFASSAVVPQPKEAPQLSAAPDFVPKANGLIAFLRGPDQGRELFTARADGTGQRRLTGPDVREFSWSPDGKQIAYLRARPLSSSPDLYVTRVDGTRQRRILQHLGGSRLEEETMWALSWSPAGNQIAFLSDRAPDLLSHDLYVLNADGSDLRNVTSEHPLTDIHSPSWSPDATRFLFAENVDDALYVLDANGKNLRRVFAPTLEYVLTLSWSPDGRQVLLHESDKTSDIAVIKLDDGNRRVLTRSTFDSEPAFSPNGKTIAFLRRAAIYLMNPNGTKVRRVPNGGPVIYSSDFPGQPFAWSPDGRKLAFTTRLGNTLDTYQQEIYVLSSDGTGKRRLTRNTVDDVAPAWQPVPLRSRTGEGGGSAKPSRKSD